MTTPEKEHRTKQLRQIVVNETVKQSLNGLVRDSRIQTRYVVDR